jgi:outer membrane lipoprotein carrier protein
MYQYKLRTFFLLLLFFLNPLQASANETEGIKTQIENYYNSINTIRAEFVQKNQLGQESSGIFLLSKPGKLRLNYFAPNEVDILLNRGKITYYDHKLDEFSKFNNNKPLLEFLTQKDFSLHKAGHDLNIIDEKNQYVAKITIQDADVGEVDFDIYFNKNPIKFTGFSYKDSNGNVTRVSLVNPEYNVQINKNEFEMQNSKFF